ncbi:MAG: ABC transporter ATP-binding protein/permease [Lachnospiraceae bacterium]
MKMIRYYLKAFRQAARFEPWLLPLTVILAVATGAKPFINIYFSARIVAELSGAGDTKTLTALVAVCLGLNLAFLILTEWLSPTFYTLRSRMYQKERLAIENKLFTIDYAKLENSDFQELVHLHSESMEKIFSAFVQLCWMLRDFISGLTTLICAFVILLPLFRIGLTKTGEGFIHSPAFFLVLFAAIAVSVVIILLLSSHTSKVWFQSNERYGKLNRLFRCYRDILANYNSGKEVRLYKEQALIEKEATEELLTKGETILRETSQKSAAASSYIAIIGALVGFGVYVFIGVKGLLGLFDIEALIRYTGAFMQIIAGVTSIAVTFGKNAELVPNLEYYFKIIDTKPEMEYGDREIDLNNVDIEFRDVYFRYPGAAADTLKGINLHIRAGERLAVVGRNGSGKTTFIKLLCRLYDADRGEILVNGVNIKSLSRDCCMRLFSVVFQDFKLFSLSVADNLTSGETADPVRLRQSLYEADVLERVERMAKKEETTLYKDIDKDGVEVSGGEAQKLALARALYKDAPVVVLDEPTAALDPVAEHKIYQQFNAFVEGKTAIYISHRLSSCRFCDTIAVFKKGELVGAGTHDDLLADADGEYSRLWNAQAKYYLSET